MLEFTLHEDFLEPVVRQDGAKALITFQRVSDREFPALDFTPPRNICRTRINSILRSGDVIHRAGVWYVLADESETPDYRNFWLFVANKVVRWEQPNKVVDTLTGLNRQTGMNTINASVRVAWEIMTRQPYERQIGVSNEMSRVISGQEMQLNDTIDGQQVKRRNLTLGIWIYEVQ